VGFEKTVAEERDACFCSINQRVDKPPSRIGSCHKSFILVSWPLGVMTAYNSRYWCTHLFCFVRCEGCSCRVWSAQQSTAVVV